MLIKCKSHNDNAELLILDPDVSSHLVYLVAIITISLKCAST